MQGSPPHRRRRCCSAQTTRCSNLSAPPPLLCSEHSHALTHTHRSDLSYPKRNERVISGLIVRHGADAQEAVAAVPVPRSAFGRAVDFTAPLETFVQGRQLLIPHPPTESRLLGGAWEWSNTTRAVVRRGKGGELFCVEVQRRRRRRPQPQQ